MRLNDLSGKAWVKLSKSTWVTHKLLTWCHQAPLQLTLPCLRDHVHSRRTAMQTLPDDEAIVKLITLLTRKGQTVLDPQLQRGASLQAALLQERAFVGITQTQAQCDAFKKHVQTATASVTLFAAEKNASLLEYMAPASVDLLLWEIPLFPLKSSTRPYAEYLEEVANTITHCIPLLKPKAYAVLIVADQRHHDRYYCRHADVIHVLQQTNLMLQGVINLISDRGALKAYGYPSTYVPNIINRFALIARQGSPTLANGIAGSCHGESLFVSQARRRKGRPHATP